MVTSKWRRRLTVQALQCGCSISDIIHGRISLADFTGLAACGGFSYGDVLGAGGGWANLFI